MKKVNYIAAGISALTLAGMMLPVGQVLAVDQSKKSVAEINVEAGVLTLEKVPDLRFDKVSIAELAGDTGVTKNLLDNSVSDQGPVKTGSDNKDGNSDGELTITDYRGSGVGWELTAQVGEMINGAGLSLAGSIVLKGSTPVVDGSTPQSVSPDTEVTLPINGAAVTIWKAAAKQGQGKNTSTFKANGGTKIELASNKTAVTGLYQAPITWTLSDAPK